MAAVVAESTVERSCVHRLVARCVSGRFIEIGDPFARRISLVHVRHESNPPPPASLSPADCPRPHRSILFGLGTASYEQRSIFLLSLAALLDGIHRTERRLPSPNDAAPYQRGRRCCPPARRPLARPRAVAPGGWANGNSPYNVSGATYFNSVFVGLSTTGVLNHTAGTFRDDNNCYPRQQRRQQRQLQPERHRRAYAGMEYRSIGSGFFTQSGGTITLSLDLLLGAQTGRQAAATT